MSQKLASRGWVSMAAGSDEQLGEAEVDGESTGREVGIGGPWGWHGNLVWEKVPAIYDVILMRIPGNGRDGLSIRQVSCAQVL